MVFYGNLGAIEIIGEEDGLYQDHASCSYAVGRIRNRADSSAHRVSHEECIADIDAR